MAAPVRFANLKFLEWKQLKKFKFICDPLLTKLLFATFSVIGYEEYRRNLARDPETIKHDRHPDLENIRAQLK